MAYYVVSLSHCLFSFISYHASLHSFSLAFSQALLSILVPGHLYILFSLSGMLFFLLYLPIQFLLIVLNSVQDSVPHETFLSNCPYQLTYPASMFS